MTEQKDTANIKHAEYEATAAMRDTFEDVCCGTAAIREKHTTYLPKFPLEHQDDYAARWAAATLLPVTAKTVETMCGLVFQKDIKAGEDVPAEIEKLWENIDNKGNHLNVFARDLFEDSFDGWAVILVDAPTHLAKDKGEENALGLRPYWAKYDACDVINWDYQVNPISRRTELSLIVLRECTSVPAGRYRRKEVTRYRTFMLEAGRVFWRLDEEQKKDNGDVEIVEVVGDTPLDKLTAIPVAVVGELGDEPPLIDLAQLNIKHAQKTSDYDTIIHKTCVPIPFTTGVEAAEFAKVQTVGSTMYHLPKAECTIGFAEVSGNAIGAARTDLDDLKADMAWSGLQMLMPKPKGGKATATEVVSDHIQDTSGLQVMAVQLKDAIERAMGFTAEYLGKGRDQGGSIELGCSWEQMVLGSQELLAWNTMAADGNVSLETFLWKLEKAGQLPPDVTAQQELERIKAEATTLTPTITPVRNAQMLPNGEPNAKITNNPPPAA